ncbi:MAG TPA: dephospho-CoA kinase, partial [Micromonospora sp.]
MLMVGLTGGIGAGKSVVASRLAGLGAVLVDSDVLAREVVAPGTDGLREIVAAFGDRVLDEDGALDRPALGEVVFGDDPARARLEGIVHPRVRDRRAELIAAAPADAVVVNDVPLLVEVGLAPAYHLVVVVEASRASRIDRLVRHRGMPVEQAEKRIRAQAGDAERRAAADVLLTNDADLADLHQRVDTLWRERLLPFERNVRERRVVPAPVTAVAADPGWPAQYARLAARIRHALARPDLLVEHVGPTAAGVPAAPD